MIHCYLLLLIVSAHRKILLKVPIYLTKNYFIEIIYRYARAKHYLNENVTVSFK